MKRLALVGTAIGLGLTLTPLAANAAPTDAPVVSQVAGTASKPPLDTTGYDQLEDIYYDLLSGGEGHATIVVKGKPGAEITYSVNGVAQTKLAGKQGKARFDVTFERGNNDIAVSQTVKGVSSAVETFGYDFS